MELTSAKTIKNLLAARGIRPSRGLGQNFLIDKAAIRKIIETAELQPDDTVLEIGPGLGVLTQELAKMAKKVVAVEKDRNMVEIMKETLKDFKNVDVIYGDILRFNIRESDSLSNLSGSPTPVSRTSQISKVVGNLPFYLTAHLIRQLLERTEDGPLYAVLVVQKEVGQRICAKPPDTGTSRAGRGMNLLAVSVQFYAEPKIISYISKNSFWPSPEVDAAILKIQNTRYQIPDTNRDLFFKIVKAGFSHPRKQLINNLSLGLDMEKEKTGEWLFENGIQPNQRAETLSIDHWRNLTKSFKIKE
ncbi:MAG: 16S rRNA (adenine(1518)-N(6)/adenine(1519)-N(6))-dimethyltransferase RsmA [bacterium]|nr:16S rRNA (adenine(1518)-N(6)/adenine(1519)-N(6))-dimethyltransferase RsmA [bacterium]